MVKTSLGWLVLCVGTLPLTVPMTVTAADVVTLENVQEPAANRKEEPKATAFSLERAVHFLDSAAVDWQKQRKCFTCHTNYAFLYARPAISAENETHRTVRQYAEELVRDRWPDKGPRWDAEVVATAAALAFNDAATTKKLHPVTKQALDKMWTLQRPDGGWDWLKCDWPPMESDDHYGATLAAIAVGVAPEDYARTPAAQAGLAKLVEYLKANPAPTVHHQAMQLWASVYVEQLLGKDEREKKEQREKMVATIWSLQRADGGWNLASLGNWQRGDKSPQDTESSDGYATGFLTYVLRMSGTPASDERLLKAVAWLKANQRESGRWFTRSLHADGKHFISHAGTAFAIMAIAAAESDPVGAPTPRSN